MADSFDGGLQLSDEERRIINILKEVGDELDNDPRIKSIIREVATGSVASLPYNVFTQLIREFVALVVSSTKVSAEMLEKIVRIFIKMWRGPELSSKVLQEMYPGTSVDDPDTVDGVYIPQEVTLMDDEFIEKYKHVLKFGRQKVRSIRLMVVGMFGVGKTSLVENLVHREDSTEKKPPKSTVGIDVTHCNIRDGEWIENIFDDNTCDKLLEVMQNPSSSSSDAPVDDVDAGYERYPNEDVPLPDEDANNEEILYKRTAKVQEEDKSTDTESPSTEEINTDTEELKMKLTKAKDDDPGLHAFATDLFKSNFKPYNPIDSTISIWDFAGQYIYYSTHHFFLNSRSIYLLMMDISTPLNDVVKETSDFPLSGFIPKDFTCLEAFKFWLNSIHMYSTQFEAEIKPSVILVGTKKDKLNGTEEEKEVQKEEYFNEALKSLIDSPALKHVHPKKFLINNLDTHEDFRKIREEVVMLAQKQRYWGEWRPARWITLERSFLGLKSEGKEIITFDEVKHVDKEKSEIPIQDETELRFFLKFQHQLGNILYYETDMLKNYVILSPQWIIDAFRCFITHVKDKDPRHVKVKDIDPRQLKDWDNYDKKAILTQELINEIMDHTEENKYFRDYKNQVIEYMEHLDMIAKPIDATIYQGQENKPGNKVGWEMEMPVDIQTSISDKKVAAPVNFYIVPSLLKLRPEHTEISNLVSPTDCKEKTPILCFHFTNNFMPPSVFHRLLAVCIRQWTIVSKSNCALLFNGFAVFRVSRAEVLSIWFHDNIIYARVSFYSKADKSIPQRIRKFLSQHLTEILRILPKESRISEVLPFEEYIQCLCVQEFEANTCLLRMREFFTHDEVFCEYNLHTAKKDEVIGMWCFTSIQNQQNTEISNAALDRQPTAKELARVSRTIGNKYFQLWKELGLERAVLDQIEDDDRFHLPTRIYHMLCKWQSRSCGPVRQLRNAILAVDCDICQFDNVFVADQFESACIDQKKLDEVHFKRKPSDEEIALIASGIGHEYWLLAVELGLDEVQLQQCREDYPYLATRAKCILDVWNQGNSDIEYLGKAMFLADSNMEAFYKVFSKYCKN
ncbi:uncharacterized protein LOC132743428 [Ruditapes philippinarum]|uniref:uncharacterized protein LOC132743428 n=1 Tax=Ruditapes philippinarum TaxID=129788 RepID=UPI00295AA506|nr:uncharacterized protein LOC132743428 [Ruditapes philippinarum]XP_060587932.1 uncharacterized protein LOC132743428 [Ruditapes philippinarum]